jgi:FtsP/CotA-like multicopper oxidase with cupredoxin domain
MRILLSILLGSFISMSSYSATYNVRLIITSGTLNLAGGVSAPGITYSENQTFQQASDLFIWLQGDDVNLKVVNMDNADHGFMIDGYADYGTIVAGDSVEQNIPLNSIGVFRYYDPVNSPYNEYMGLSGIVHVKDPSDNIPYFYWDIREFEESWNTTIDGGGSPVLNTYNPAFFTINGNANPDINTDPVARVSGNVGNEFRIVMVNNGISIHSMHFHGYHLIIEDDSRSPGFVGRDKDTFPLYPKEHQVLSCIPDKEGEYPVHDHNLVAVTGNSEYANGMFVTMLISP